MSRSITFLNKLLSDRYWIILFFSLLISAFISTGFAISRSPGILHIGFIGNIVGGFAGSIFTIIGALVFAVVLKLIGSLFRAQLSFNTYVRIAVIDILISLLLGLFPMHSQLYWKILTECTSATYLCLAIWAGVPVQRRTWTMLLIGLVPSLFALLFLLLPSQTLPSLPLQHAPSPPKVLSYNYTSGDPFDV